MSQLNAKKRSQLPKSAFAYVDSKGRRRLPINDEPHVRNALARFNQVSFEDDAARERARKRLLNAAKKYRIVPVGFIDGQLRSERTLRTRTTDGKTLPTGLVTFLLTDIEGSTALLRQLGDRYADLLGGPWWADRRLRLDQGRYRRIVAGRRGATPPRSSSAARADSSRGAVPGRGRRNPCGLPSVADRTCFANRAGPVARGAGYCLRA